MFSNIFKPKKTVRDKVVDGFKKPIQETLEHLTNHQTKKDKLLNFLLRFFLYMSIFVSGFVVAKLHSLLNMIA